MKVHASKFCTYFAEARGLSYTVTLPPPHRSILYSAESASSHSERPLSWALFDCRLVSYSMSSGAVELPPREQLVLLQLPIKVFFNHFFFFFVVFLQMLGVLHQAESLEF